MDFKGLLSKNPAAAFVQVLAFITAVGVCVCGGVHVGNVLEKWCDNQTAGTSLDNNTDCVGPNLRWNKDDFDFTRDSNRADFNGQAGWRSAFTFRPELFIDLWTPVVFAVFAIGAHIEHLRLNLICDNWLRFALFHVLMALWGVFGYAGNLGIIFGFFACAVSGLALVMVRVAPTEPPHLELKGILGLGAHPVSPRASQATAAAP